MNTPAENVPGQPSPVRPSGPGAVEALENPSALAPGAETGPAAAPASAPVCVKGLLCDSAEALDAQISIWKLQFTLAVVRVALGVVLALLLFALAVYGFTLLDAAAHWPLARHLPPWVSPLVRGVLYVAAPLIILRPALALLLQKNPSEAGTLREESTHAA